MKIGVFDSGIGGEAIALRLQELFPTADILSINDHQHMPYGTKTNDEIIRLTNQAIQPLLHAKCDAIVIACNTATVVAIDALRTSYPETNFIGIEPMVKTAAKQTKTGHIAVLATPATLASEHYKVLKEMWAGTLQVIEPDCHDWAELIENKRTEEVNVEAVVRDLMQANVDVIVLGCTHYHWSKDRFIAASNGIEILEPSDAIGARIKSLITEVN